MSSSRLTKSRLILLASVSACFILAVLCFAIYFLHQLGQAKALRTTTGVVRAKKHVRFDWQNFTYIDDVGERAQDQPGSEEWRIYYEIDNFDQVPEPTRSELWKSEQERIRKFGFRFRSYPPPEKESYDKAQVGDQLQIEYHYMGSGEEILAVRNLTHPNSSHLNKEDRP